MYYIISIVLMEVRMEQALTKEDVARLLQISIQTVYDHKKELGAFYPVGMRVLRFRREVINGILEGPKDAPLEIQVRIPETAFRQTGLA